MAQGYDYFSEPVTLPGHLTHNGDVLDPRVEALGVRMREFSEKGWEFLSVTIRYFLEMEDEVEYLFHFRKASKD